MTEQITFDDASKWVYKEGVEIIESRKKPVEVLQNVPGVDPSRNMFERESVLFCLEVFPNEWFSAANVVQMMVPGISENDVRLKRGKAGNILREAFMDGILERQKVIRTSGNFPHGGPRWQYEYRLVIE